MLKMNAPRPCKQEEANYEENLTETTFHIQLD